MNLRTPLLAFASLLALAGAADAKAHKHHPARPRHIPAVQAVVPPPEQEVPGREALPINVTPITYQIDLTPDAEKRVFSGTEQVEFQVHRPTSTIVVNALELDIKSATLEDGRSAKISLDPKLERATFTFSGPISASRHVLQIAYTGKINDSAAGLFAAPYKTAAGEQRVMLVTQFEPGDARRLAPMWDEPKRKAVFTIEATVPKDQLAVSNMPVAAETPAGPGLKHVLFQPSAKMSSYLVFFGVGDFERLSGVSGPTQLGIVTKAGDKAKGQVALDDTTQLLPFYNQYFGVSYPLPKLDQIAVPGAGGFGAMENWGAIMYFEPTLLFDPAISGEAERQRIFGTVAHEMAHQWFGDLVTMEWWSDIWLNEGFASWMATKATAKFNPDWKPWLQTLEGQEGAMALDARSSTHPIVQNVKNTAEANQAFDAITYRKGQAVIRMIESFVGEDAFRTGVRSYMHKHAYGNTVTDDLWAEVETASNQPVRAIMADFARQGGVPMVTVQSAACANGQTEVKLAPARFGVDAASRTARSWRIPLTLQTLGAETPTRLVMTDAATVTLPGCGALIVNKDRAGYFRVAFDDASFAALRGAFGKLETADQLTLLYDRWAIGGAGQEPLARYFDLVAGAPQSVDPLVTRQISGAFEQLRGLYAGQTGEAAFRAYAVQTLKPALQRLGWSAAANESPNAALLRNNLIVELARFGDADTIAEARRLYLASAANPGALPAPIRAAVLGAVGASADQTIWSDLAARAAAAKSPLEQRQYLAALAGVLDPALAQKSLDLFITDATPKQLAPNLALAVAGEHPDLVWTFYLAHAAQLAPGLDPLQRLQFPTRIAMESADLKRADELQAFAQKNLPADAKKSVDEALAKIRQAAEMRTQRLPEVNAWLAQR